MATVDNRAAACDGWVVTYSSNGFATVSVLLQSAPLGTGGIAGTFVSFAGTIVSPTVNPTTATTEGEIKATGYFPYVNVAITTTGSGYLVAEFHGFKTNPNAGAGGGSSGGCAGTSATPCVVDGPTAAGSAATKPPVMVGGRDTSGNVQSIATSPAGGIIPATGSAPDQGDNVSFNSFGGPLYTTTLGSTVSGPGTAALLYVFNGQNWNRGLSCTNRANVTLTTIGLTVIIPASFGNTHICSLSLSFASPVDIQVVEGTQTTTACDTGASNMTGVFRSVTGFDPSTWATSPLVATNFNDAVCLRMSASVNGGGVATYATY
jgi:hypothetical protein